MSFSTNWGYLLSYERAFSSPVYTFRIHECLPSFLHGVVLMHRLSFIFIFFNYLTSLNASYVQSQYNTRFEVINMLFKGECNGSIGCFISIVYPTAGIDRSWKYICRATGIHLNMKLAIHFTVLPSIYWNCCIIFSLSDLIVYIFIRIYSLFMILILCFPVTETSVQLLWKAVVNILCAHINYQSCEQWI